MWKFKSVPLMSRHPGEAMGSWGKAAISPKVMLLRGRGESNLRVSEGETQRDRLPRLRVIIGMGKNQPLGQTLNTEGTEVHRAPSAEESPAAQMDETGVGGQGKRLNTIPRPQLPPPAGLYTEPSYANRLPTGPQPTGQLQL